MLNKKLKAIAKLINKEDIVLDTCCDHAYLAIYLKKNNLAKEVYASDISAEALKGAIKNIEEAKVDIKTYLADGFKNIANKTINTVVIAGVGENVVKNILTKIPDNISKIIISSNNRHYEIRKRLAQLNFKLTYEEVVEENKKFYPIMVYVKGQDNLSKQSLRYGISNNKEYFKYLLTKEKEILNNIPLRHFKERFRHLLNIYTLKRLIKRNVEH